MDQITPQEFAQELHQARLSKEMKQRILDALDKLSYEKILEIYRILRKARVRHEQALLKLEVGLKTNLLELKEQAAKILSK